MKEMKRVENGTDPKSMIVEALIKSLTNEYLHTLIEGHKMFDTLPDQFTAMVMDKQTRSKYTISVKAIHDLSPEEFNKEIEAGLSVELSRKAQKAKE